MAATCFCGCGRKVGLMRRGLNDTGSMVAEELDGWEGLGDLLDGERAPAPGLREFVGEGGEMREALLEITHGGRLYMRFSQREIARWLNESREIREAAESGGLEEVSRLAAVRARDADLGVGERPEDLEQLRRDYEGRGAEQCPVCGEEFDDRGAYLVHITSAHEGD